MGSGWRRGQHGLPANAGDMSGYGFDTGY